MKAKSTYLGKCRDKYSRAVHLFYKYKGIEYMITDYHCDTVETLPQQHKHEQNRIDQILEQEKQNSSKFPLSETVDKVMDELLKFWEN